MNTYPSLTFFQEDSLVNLPGAVIQSSTIEKYKQKWLDAVEKYYTEILPTQEAEKLEMDAVNEDKKTD